MSDDSTTECLLFPGIFLKPVVAQFDQREGSSDGGALLLKAADGHYRLVEELTACLQDQRQAGKVDHTLQDLVARRVSRLPGYPDGNDSARLGSDPIHKLLLGRDPIEGSTWPRNRRCRVSRMRSESRSCIAWARLWPRVSSGGTPKRLRRRVYRVTIDLDPTDDPTHGAQQLSFFNGHYDSWCYLPVMGFISFNEEAEQYLCAAVLRPGNARRSGRRRIAAAADPDHSWSFSWSDHSGSPGWWFCQSRGAGVFGCVDQTGICGGHGQKRSPEADRGSGNSSRS